MSNERTVAWYFAFLPYGVAMGILSILVPLYLVEELGGSLIDLGTMVFVATASVIPASIYLGRLPDRYRRVRLFILASFLGVSIVLLLMSVTTSVVLFQGLYVLMNLVDYIKGPSTRILIAESYESSGRGSVLAKQSFVEGIGEAMGLALCSFTINLFGYKAFLSLTGPLVLASFFLALFTIRDPPLYIERFLDRLDRQVVNIETFSFNLTERGTMSPGWRNGLSAGREPNMGLFGLGRAFFSFAASNAFTVLPVYLLVKAGFPNSIIFASFLIRSIFGAASFLFIGKVIGNEGNGVVKLATGARVLLVLVLPAAVLLPMPFSVVAVATLLSAIAFSWSLYSVGVEIVTLTYASPGSLGVYDALTGIGGAIGSFTGGLIPTLYGFDALYVVSSVLFASALLIFFIGLRK